MAIWVAGYTHRGLKISVDAVIRTGTVHRCKPLTHLSPWLVLVHSLRVVNPAGRQNQKGTSGSLAARDSDLNILI